MFVGTLSAATLPRQVFWFIDVHSKRDGNTSMKTTSQAPLKLPLGIYANKQNPLLPSVYSALLHDSSTFGAVHHVYLQA